MKRAILLGLFAVAACKSSSPGTPSPSPTAAPVAGDVTVTLATPATEYKAEFRKTGGIAAPVIPLTLVVKNAGDATWKCEGAISLSAEGEGGKTSESRTFLTTLSPCELAPGAEHREELEAGEFLTEVAGRHMKGDRLAVRASLAPSAASAPVALSVFVPEG